MAPAQIYLLEKLFTRPTVYSLEAEYQRRNDAVVAISPYCPVLEGGPLRGRRKRVTPVDGFDQERDTEVAKPAKKSHGGASNVTANPAPHSSSNAEYSAYKSILRHFRQKHLNDRICNMCDEDLLHEMHLRRHAEDVHRLSTERNYYPRQLAGSDSY
ncbi:hypothetical protein FE257_005502 [Aspergillus nanangensis]|uniref:C2H2-type domain-containing protein n=1 Tax=Aspergillus nanangensis TaxID=2582783 RepID=A0AAD4CBF0_ASPNN|nr:hypothetical protein FE257_005502 [Aspergillus nanangensis]